MKRTYFYFPIFLMLLFSLKVSGQRDSDGMKPPASLEPPRQERLEDLYKAKLDLIRSSVSLSADKLPVFEQILQQYEMRQMGIFQQAKYKKDSFYKNQDMSQEDYKKRIYENLEIAQRLLDNRREFVPKFLEVLAPSELDKMFEMEKKFGKKIMESHR